MPASNAFRTLALAALTLAATAVWLPVGGCGSSECTPPCRRGFTCVDGECKSVCNPPCTGGLVCEPSSATCKQAAQQDAGGQRDTGSPADQAPRDSGGPDTFEPGPPDTVPEATPDPLARGVITGTVTRPDRFIPKPPPGDMKGNLYVAAYNSCMPMGAPAAFAIVGHVDFSAGSASAKFEIQGVPPGKWKVLAYLDDNGNASAVMPLPDKGDVIGCSDGVADVKPGALSKVDVKLALVFSGF